MYNRQHCILSLSESKDIIVCMDSNYYLKSSWLENGGRNFLTTLKKIDSYKKHTIIIKPIIVTGTDKSFHEVNECTLSPTKGILC
jgi:hypothetical protein